MPARNICCCGVVSSCLDAKRTAAIKGNWARSGRFKSKSLVLQDRLQFHQPFHLMVANWSNSASKYRLELEGRFMENG